MKQAKTKKASKVRAEKKKKTGEKVQKKEEKKLRVLILEDNPADVELMERKLKKNGIPFVAQRVESKSDYLMALKKFKPELILADYKLPKFDALQALALRKINSPFTPFIIVTGTISEEAAVECMKQGADDYLLKDRLARLGEAARRALSKRLLLKAKEDAEREVVSRKRLYHTFINSSADMAFLKDGGFRYLIANRALCRFFGKPEAKIRGKTDFDLLAEGAAARCREGDELALKKKKPVVMEEAIGDTIFETRKFPVRLIDGSTGIGGFIRDVTKTRRAEKEMQAAAIRWRTTFDSMNDAVCLLDEKGAVQQCNRAMNRLLELPFNRIIGTNCLELICGKEKRKTCAFTKMMKVRQRMEEENFWRGHWYHITVDPVISPAGALAGAVHIMTDITQKKEAEAKRLASEKNLRDVFHSHPGIAGISTFAEGKYLEINDNFSTILGWTREEVIGRTSKEIDIFADYAQRQEMIIRLRRDGFLNGFSVKLKNKTGELKDALFSATIIEYNGESCLLAQVIDISELKKAQDALQEMNEIFRLFLQHNPIYVFIKDEDIRPIHLSKNYEKMLGRPLQEILGKSMDELFPFELSRAMIEDDKKILREGIPHEFIEELGDRTYSTLKFPIFIEGKAKYLAGYTTDITESKQAQDQLKASLREKEILLKEIHHRVKNNLQVISGLLTLQAAQIDDERLLRVIKESQSRIWTMALIHQTLYQSGNLAGIDMGDYIRQLSSNLLSSHAQVAMPPTLHFDLIPLQLAIDKAIPLALIVNELLINAVKHAFSDGRTGDIRIVLRECRDKSRRVPIEDIEITPKEGMTLPAYTHQLSIADNGIGLPQGFNAANQKSLGLQLVAMLAKQIEGKLRIESGHGTSVRIIFTVDEANKKHS